MAKANAAARGQRPDPSAFLHPRPDAGTAPDDPLRNAKGAAVTRSEVLGAAALGRARQFVRSDGSGRTARIAPDTRVAQAVAKVAAIRADENLSAPGKQAALAAESGGVREEATAVLATIANTRQKEAPGPGPGAV